MAPPAALLKANDAMLNGDGAKRGSRGPLTVEELNPNVTEMEYAVRGKIVQRAEQHVAALDAGESRPFPDVVMCNIGNPQAVGQPPLTFIRQLFALCTCPDLLNNPSALEAFPDDVVARAKSFLDSCSGTGAYSTSKGIPAIRKKIAAFIQARDGTSCPEVDPELLFLTNGASEGVKTMLSLIIRDKSDGVLIPVPQYPLYSASLTLLGGAEVPYYLDEDAGWALAIPELERAVADAKERGVTPRAIAVINPGNPTGAVLAEDNMREVVRFCAEHELVLMADEVYQENVYVEHKPFVSFKKIVAEMSDVGKVQLASFHSTSKGVLGECGARGGFLELYNFHDAVVEQVYKMASVNLCSNIVGQIATSVLVERPVKGDASYELWQKEYDDVFNSLKRKAKKLVKALNTFEGVSCNEAEGALYCFPRLTLPQKALDAADEKDMKPDVFYCMELLDNTGVCVVPGSGFHQYPGTLHFRTTFLPPEDKIDAVIERMSTFHRDFMAKYSDESSSKST